MDNTLRRLLNNLGSWTLALLLAFAIWIAATLQADPFVKEEIANIPITMRQQPANTVLFNQSQVSDRVSVEVRAPQSVLARLKPTDLVATMDLSGVQSGIPSPVTIQVTSTNEALRIGAINPDKQIVHLEMEHTITLPIQIQVRGEVAIGYQAAPAQVTPEQITLLGPDPYLASVISVTGVIDISGARQDVTDRVNLTPVDANGKAVTGLQLTPKQAEVRVGVRRRFGYKPDVEVVPDLRGKPAAGYRQGIVLIDPSTVTLQGPPSILDKMPGFVETLPISITGATESLSQRTALTLPTGITVIGGNLVTVLVEILPIQSSRTLTGTVELQGLQPGLVATASPSIVEIILEGPDPKLAELKPQNLQIVVNLYGYTPGIYRIKPEVLTPEKIEALSIIPETIEVEIKAAPTPTLTFPPAGPVLP